jgi:hypothetical protein
MSIITGILLVLVIQALAGILAGVLTFRLLKYVNLGAIEFIYDRNSAIGHTIKKIWSFTHYLFSIVIGLLVAWSFKIGWSIVAVLIIISAINRYGIRYGSQKDNQKKN